MRPCFAPPTNFLLATGKNKLVDSRERSARRQSRIPPKGPSAREEGGGGQGGEQNRRARDDSIIGAGCLGGDRIFPTDEKPVRSAESCVMPEYLSVDKCILRLHSQNFTLDPHLIPICRRITIVCDRERSRCCVLRPINFARDVTTDHSLSTPRPRVTG